MSGKINPEIYAIYLANQHKTYDVLEAMAMADGLLDDMPEIRRAPHIKKDFDELWTYGWAPPIFPTTEKYIKYVAETLMPLIIELENAYNSAKDDPLFIEERESFARDYVGRESPLYFAERLTEYAGGSKIYFKRDELNHTGSHKINNCLGQILLAKRMGKKRIIAETGAGQHGVAVATVCARFDLPCVIYMGETDIERQKPNVFKIKLLGGEVIPVSSGNGTLKDAMNEALRDWVSNVDDTFYIIGTAAGPHPYPQLVRDFQSIIGIEAKKQIQIKES